MAERTQQAQRTETREYAALGLMGNINNSNPIAIGQDGTLSYSEGFNGQIDEVRIWKSLVADSTIAQWGGQSVTNSHPNYGDLVGYWKLDEGTGNSSADASSTGSNLTFSGATWATASAMNYTNYYEFPSTVDLVPTALDHLCIPIDPSWGIQGRSYVTCMNSTSVTQLAASQDAPTLSVHPNPANHQLTVTFPTFLAEDYHLYIMDAHGKMIQKFSDANSHMASFNIQDLPPGLYLVRLQSNKWDGAQFFVKQ